MLYLNVIVYVGGGIYWWVIFLFEFVCVFSIVCFVILRGGISVCVCVWLRFVFISNGVIVLIFLRCLSFVNCWVMIL